MGALMKECLHARKFSLAAIIFASWLMHRMGRPLAKFEPTNTERVES